MNTTRQKRLSCEACRTRKLRCSGQRTGCSRCVNLALDCKFADKGMPGRPRKWLQIEPRQQHQGRPRQRGHRQDEQGIAQDAIPYQQVSDVQRPEHAASADVTGASSVATASSTDLGESTTTSYGDNVLSGHDHLGPLPVLDFDTSVQLGSLPLDFFGPCLSNDGHGRTRSDVSATSIAPLQTCDCEDEVFDTIRILRRGPISHESVRSLRLGVDLFEKLLTCRICYDVLKPPRITLQNVLLIGRLSLEVTTGYQKYLEWLRDYCNGLASRKEAQTVYLIPGLEANSLLGFEMQSDNLRELVMHGLQGDAQRLSDLGRRFATRQHNRHLIGHEACPGPEGRCWKEGYEIHPDPSDVCPQSADAKVLTPCYRVVDEVRSKISLFENAVK